MTGTNGVTTLAAGATKLHSTVFRPCGIALSRDEKYIYFTDNVRYCLYRTELATMITEVYSGNPTAPGTTNGIGTSARHGLGYQLDWYGEHRLIWVDNSYTSKINLLDTRTAEFTTITVYLVGTTTVLGIDQGRGIAVHKSGKYVLVTSQSTHVVRKLYWRVKYVSMETTSAAFVGGAAAGATPDQRGRAAPHTTIPRPCICAHEGGFSMSVSFGGLKM